MALRREGVNDADVLRAIERTPRERFVAEGFEDRAYDDAALPIECGQTISQPFVVAVMTQTLAINDRCKVLEVGTGSGYQAAVLARLARRVYSLERYRHLLRAAEARFQALRLTNIVTRLGDGAKGWPEQAPFDRIIVTAAARVRPDALLEQLKPGGIMAAPVGESETQTLYRYDKDESGAVSETALMPVRFVPLLEGVARSGD